MSADLSMPGALERLDRWLASTVEGRAVLARLEDPATDKEIDELRHAIEPYPIPHEIETLLRWHNGEDPDSRKPSLLPIDGCSPLLGTNEMARHRSLLENLGAWQWNPLWLPITAYGWQQVAIAVEGPSVVLHSDFGDLEIRVLSCSLTAYMHATADIAEAGFLTDLPYGECRAMIDARADQFGWDHWHYPRTLEREGEARNWPEPWRQARGLAP